MVVIDQLVFFASLQGVPRDLARHDAMSWLRRFRIPELAERKAEELSKGNQQKIQLISAILHGPPVLLMDEPFTGLDPVNVALLREAFLELRDEGRTLIFSTHQMETVEAMCESIAIVDRGRVVVGGPLRDIKRVSGRRIVRLSIEGDHRMAWLSGVAGARVLRPGIDRTDIELDDGVEPGIVLAAAIAAGARVSHFEVAEPSLEQIFIDHVGRSPDEEVPATMTGETGSPGEDAA
jgi:ABC-2 type transport system ATP-binding protein